MPQIQVTSFTYSPIRSGYDTNTWTTVDGAPYLGVGGRLYLDDGSGVGEIMHKTDILKGDILFNVFVPSTPSATGDSTWGVKSPNSGAYMVFVISSADEDLKCVVSDGTTTTASDTVEWNTDWNNAGTRFLIRWEAGLVKFVINDTCVYTAAGDEIPPGPLSIYAKDADRPAPRLSFGDFVVSGSQSVVKE